MTEYDIRRAHALWLHLKAAHRDLRVLVTGWRSDSVQVPGEQGAALLRCAQELGAYIDTWKKPLEDEPDSRSQAVFISTARLRGRRFAFSARMRAAKAAEEAWDGYYGHLEQLPRHMPVQDRWSYAIDRALEALTDAGAGVSEESTEIRTRQCVHIAPGKPPLHSVFTWNTVEPNPTDYRWHERILLCAFCSGQLRGRLSSDGPALEEVP